MGALKTALLTITFLIIMSFEFQSSAVENIEILNEQVVVTFNNGRDYTYNAPNLDNFVSQLTEVIENEKSVGSFINTAIRDKQLVNV